mmetsp:Transcript_100153/g.172948  ORF Transcript_100153/g.172948 Transcript_100153/m.172948 type:complete len:481 (-) Transcript_100153:158-1600(-)
MRPCAGRGVEWRIGAGLGTVVALGPGDGLQNALHSLRHVVLMELEGLALDGQHGTGAFGGRGRVEVGRHRHEHHVLSPLLVHDLEGLLNVPVQALVQDPERVLHHPVVRVIDVGADEARRGDDGHGVLVLGLDMRRVGEAARVGVQEGAVRLQQGGGELEGVDRVLVRFDLCAVPGEVVPQAAVVPLAGPGVGALSAIAFIADPCSFAVAVVRALVVGGVQVPVITGSALGLGSDYTVSVGLVAGAAHDAGALDLAAERVCTARGHLPVHWEVGVGAATAVQERPIDRDLEPPNGASGWAARPHTAGAGGQVGPGLHTNAFSSVALQPRGAGGGVEALHARRQLAGVSAGWQNQFADPHVRRIRFPVRCHTHKVEGPRVQGFQAVKCDTDVCPGLGPIVVVLPLLLLRLLRLLLLPLVAVRAFHNLNVLLKDVPVLDVLLPLGPVDRVDQPLLELVEQQARHVAGQCEVGTDGQLLGHPQ